MGEMALIIEEHGLYKQHFSSDKHQHDLGNVELKNGAGGVRVR
jgi:hypothetical protein